MEEPDASDCAGTTVPEPFAAVSTLILTGGPGFTVRVCEFDNPPPPAVKTVTGKVPNTSKSLAGIEAVNCVELMKVVVLSEPLNRTVDFPLINSLPFTVSVNAGSPALFDAGLMLVVAGAAVIPIRLFVSDTVQRERSLIPAILIVRKVVLTVPPRLFHDIPPFPDL